MTRRIVTVTVIVALGLLVGGVAMAQPAQNTIADHYAAMAQAAATHDFSTAWKEADALLQVANSAKPESLTGTDLYAIGRAHYYLMAQAYDKAIAAGGLNAEQLAQAKKMRDAIMSAGLDVKVISHGETIDLAAELVPGKTNIVDFFSEYCGPCRRFSPVVESVAAKRSDVAVVKVDINRPNVQGIDWTSPVARQFDLSGIPYVRIYGPDGKMISDGATAYQQVLKWAGEE